MRYLWDFGAFQEFTHFENNVFQNTQSITASPYWSNLYGHDATNEEDIDPKEKEILLLCLTFTKELSKTPINKRKLRKFIHPEARSGWGNFQMAQEYYNSIPNPGFSTKIRYNDNKDTAYVRIFRMLMELLLSALLMYFVKDTKLLQENGLVSGRFINLAGISIQSL